MSKTTRGISMESNLVSDADLTEFLITCFSGIFEGALKPVKNASTPETLQYSSKSGDLSYLETSSGDMYHYESDISVRHGEANRCIWSTHVTTDINKRVLERIGLAPIQLRLFLRDARQIGFLETLESIKKNEDFCLWDIPDQTQPIVIGNNGVRGDLIYEETIPDNLNDFRGYERIRFKPEGSSERPLLYTASFVGGRL